VREGGEEALLTADEVGDVAAAPTVVLLQRAYQLLTPAVGSSKM